VLYFFATSGYKKQRFVACQRISKPRHARACGPKSAVLKQTNQNFKPKSQTVKPKLQKTASFPCFSAIWFKVSGFWVKPSNRIVKPNAKAQTELVKF
jgi:hypothetical protein